MTIVRFDVVGNPAPQGDKSAVLMHDKTGKPYAGLVEGKTGDARKRHGNWRSAVAEAARNHAPATPLDGPLVLRVLFRFSMPASRSKADHAAGWCPKVSAPDADKLIRAVGDSLKDGGLIADDARFVATLAGKIEVVGWTGAKIIVTQLGTPGTDDADPLASFLLP